MIQATRLACALALFAPAAGAAQSAAPRPEVVRQAVSAHLARHQHAILGELTALLAIPNVARDSANIRRNAAAVMALLERRGLAPRLLEVDGGAPAVFGELRVPGATRTVVFYAHYDGQPVDTARWHSAPWTPVLRAGGDARGAPLPPPDTTRPLDPDWRLFARSASDDKAPVIGLLAALDALREAGLSPSVNLKFFFDGEEEAGSPHVAALLRRHAALLGADAWVFCDGPAHPSGRPQVVYGVRGVFDLEMTVYGPSRALHSGHYGNWAPNPIVRLAALITALRDENGRILIAGFHDDVRPLSAADRAAIAALPPVDAALRAELQLGGTEGEPALLAERIALPALNLRGIRGGATGALVTNSIPTEATASIDFRLVPDQTPEHIRALLESHLRGLGYFISYDAPDSAIRMAHPKLVRLQWGAGYPALRTPMSLPVSRAMARVADQALPGRTLAVPILGGSLPMHEFDAALHVPLIILAVVNYDNNQHSSDENLRLGHLWDGIGIYAMAMARLGAEWSAASAAEARP